MRTALSIGVLFVLFSGTVHSEPLQAWLAGGPVCKMACAGTADCCCKKQQRNAGSSRRDGTTILTEQPVRPCCPTPCATAGASDRSVASDTTARTGLTRPFPRAAFLIVEAVHAVCRGLNGARRPRAPPMTLLPA